MSDEVGSSARRKCVTFSLVRPPLVPWVRSKTYGVMGVRSETSFLSTLAAGRSPLGLRLYPLTARDRGRLTLIRRPVDVSVEHTRSVTRPQCRVSWLCPWGGRDFPKGQNGPLPVFGPQCSVHAFPFVHLVVPSGLLPFR